MTASNNRLLMQLRRSLPLLPAILLAFVAWLILNAHPASSRTTSVILLISGVSYLLAAATLLVFTKRWAMRGVGQLLTLLGDASLYLAIGISTLRGEQITKFEANLIRAFLVVGGPMLLIGIIVWVVRTHRSPRPGNIVYRRRASDFPGVTDE